MKTYPWINIEREIKCMNNLCDPKVPSITHAQDPNLGWVFEWMTCHRILMNAQYDKQLNETTQLNPQVYFINFM